MKTKIIFAISILIALLLSSSISFANNEIVGGVTGNVINSTSNVAQEVVEGTSNVAQNIVSGVGNASESAVNGISNITGGVVNGVSNMVNDVADGMDNDSLRGSTTNEYNATRRNAMSSNTFMGMDTTTWWWLIIATIAVLGVILIWNYSNKAKDTED